MMARPWYAQYPDDYERKTAHLTLIQHGAYRLLLDHYYKTEKPLPLELEVLYRVCRATKKDEKTAIISVLSHFFTKKLDGFHNSRANDEIKKANAISEKRAVSGGIGGSKPKAKRKQLLSKPEAIADTSTSTATEEERKKDMPAGAGVSVPKPKVEGKNQYPEDFEEFWKAYPTDKNMPKKLAFQRWRLLDPEKRKAAIQAIPGFKRYCAANPWYRPIYADRFLSQEKFEGYAADAEKTVTPEQIAESLDKADRLLRRDKYAEDYGERKTA